jgi:hypothetical protein
MAAAVVARTKGQGPIQHAFGNDYRHAFVLLPLLIASPAFAARGNGGMLPA